MNEPVTRDEFNMLKDQVNANGARLDAIDRNGTRGIGAVSVQLTEVIKDVATVSKDLADFRTEHGHQHEREQEARVTARRWMAGTAIAFLAAIEVPLLYLLAHVH